MLPIGLISVRCRASPRAQEMADAEVPKDRDIEAVRRIVDDIDARVRDLLTCLIGVPVDPPLS